jgi:diacylglycerol O-acyltransferase / wax synthase
MVVTITFEESKVIVMERLTAEDLVMLSPDERWPQEIGCLAVLDGGSLLDSDGRLMIEKVRAVVTGHLQLVPRFRQILSIPHLGLGTPLWVDAPGLDVSDHVRVRQLPAPADESRLLRAVEQLVARRLDRSRPLWEMWLLPGLPESRIGLLIKVHHALADGIAGLATIGALLGATPDKLAEPAPAWIPAPAPTARDLFADNLRRHLNRLRRAFAILVHPVITLRAVRSVWPAMGELISDRRGPVTSLDRVVGPDRNLALIRSSLDVIKQIARTHNATVNDVLLAIIAGGLHGLLRSRGEGLDDLVLPVYVPVALRDSASAEAPGNLIAQMVVPLPIGASEPDERLRRIAAETAKRKARRRLSLGTLLGSGIARWALLKVLDRQPVNVAIADLPGPQLPLYLAGAQLLEVFPALPLIAKVSLGVGGLSYAGQFNIMAVADRVICPDLDVFTSSARNELQALAAASTSQSDVA